MPSKLFDVDIQVTKIGHALDRKKGRLQKEEPICKSYPVLSVKTMVKISGKKRDAILPLFLIL